MMWARFFVTFVVTLRVIALQTNAEKFDYNTVWKTLVPSADGSFTAPAIYPLAVAENTYINTTWRTTFKKVDFYWYERGSQGFVEVWSE